MPDNDLTRMETIIWPIMGLTAYCVGKLLAACRYIDKAAWRALRWLRSL